MGQLGGNLRAQKWDMSTLVKFEKVSACARGRTRSSADLVAPALQNFYEEDKRVAARTEREVQEFRREKEIQVFGQNVPKPVHNFSEVRSFPP